MEKKKVLFICSRNSARSQMAEGWLRALYGDRYEAYSAGAEPSVVNPFAVRTMAEAGIDISRHRSKSAQEFEGTVFDSVVTVCDRARDACPFFPGGKAYFHQNFADPAACQGEEENILDCFRKVRDEIKGWIETTFGART
jgi:arsenate reductase